MLAVFTGLFLLTPDAKASSLFGKVIEINDGDAITVFNLNRPVRVKLLGIDAPEVGQVFGDVARKHLSDLVYDKSVLVEYWGIAANGSLVGRVLVNGTDVGAQMIRDGAAWFDPNNQSRLIESDRLVYQQSESAARSERRGLWQGENPVAPWEFVKTEALRKNPAASLNSMLPASPAKANRPIPELTSLSLLTSGIATAPPRPASSSVSEADRRWASSDSIKKNWQQFRPAGENFSALVPEEGKQMKAPVLFGDQMIDVNIYMARDGWTVYALMWITAPSFGETDTAAINDTLTGFLKGVGAGYDSRDGRSGAFSCEPRGQNNISLSGYTGREFDLTTCTVPATARAYTKVVDGQRQMYMGAVFYMEEDANVKRFLKSFTVVSPSKAARQPAKP